MPWLRTRPVRKPAPDLCALTARQRGGLIAAAVLLLSGLVLLWMQFYPPDPLAVLRPGNIVRVDALGDAPAPAAHPERLRRVLTSLQSLPDADARRINWAEARQWRVVTGDGLRLTLQAVGGTDGGWVRVTADPVDPADGRAVARAGRIRAQRQRALRLTGPDAAMLAERPAGTAKANM